MVVQKIVEKIYKNFYIIKLMPFYINNKITDKFYTHICTIFIKNIFYKCSFLI